MTIKQLGGIFGRNPTFNDVDVEGDQSITGDLDVSGDVSIGQSGSVTNLNLLRASANYVNASSSGGYFIFRTGGTTKKRLEIQDDGDVYFFDTAGTTAQMTYTASNSNLSFPSGSGIDFSATSGTGTSELFDDYEEGTWTPTLTFASAGDLSIAYSNRIGNYVKIGRVVVLTCRVTASSFTHSTSSGALRITGIPFTPASNHYSSVLFNGINKAGYTAMSAQASAGSSVILFYASAMGTGQSGVTAPNVPSGGAPFIQFTLCYETDS